jgi:hypothetical protein
METYNPSDFGPQEVALRNTFFLQMNDARNYFLNVIRPRLDRSYKLYIAYTGDRQREIKKWQANVFVPYVMSAVETLMPRILDARPEFTVQGRSSDDQIKTSKQQQLADYLWELAKMDSTNEILVRSSLIYGTGYLQVSWKKDVRKYKFLDNKDLLSKKYKYTEKEKVFYDAPFCEWVDNYQLWYDWHNTARESKQYWFKRLILSEPEIRRRYPNADKKRLQMGLNGVGGDLNDYASVRNLVKSNHQFILKGFAPITSYRGIGDDKYQVYGDPKLRMYEVFEWWRPFEDAYTVMVGNNYVPIFKGGVVPMPYDFKEAPFIEVPYLKMPYEFEGYGLPMILENPQIMLNLIKNQRLDSATLSIHKMWIVNPLANINKEELVTRPFGIIYSIDPNGVREVEFSDVKQSAYREEDLLKQDMRYSSGVDDFSMGAGGGASSATEVRHLRESTLERVRLFVNHLGDAYSDVMRYWMDMQRQFFTKKMYIRIVGQDGEVEFPLIEKDDLMGNFDYKATVLPSIAGQMDVKKKQDMDLFQLLVTLPFIDPKKLTSKILPDFGWNLDGITADEPEPGTEQPAVGPDGQPLPPGTEPMLGAEQMPGAPGAEPPAGPAEMPAGMNTGGVPPEVLMGALKILGGNPSSAAAANSGFSDASMPINLLQQGPPPTVKGISAGGGPGYRPMGKTSNVRGLNMGGKLNINTATNRDGNSNPESSLLKSVHNLQR